ncbi:LGFP repeat-containing protein [uncultured Amnibacterium sp.]|uniref:LGFP repeat-containing protein n=1 Tax=uncultured Amnibacterium sp. TaxID=1631851 RepID=UPI0035CC6848
MRAGGRVARARIRRIIAIAGGIGLVVAGVGLTALDEQSAKAAQAASVLQDFNPANIIDDAVMFNGTTMTAAEIQTFLNSKQPSCAAGATCLKATSANMPSLAANPMCRAVAGKAKATAAQIIAAVGKACNVSPQVILVMLQKEQTLVTGRTPYSGESVDLIYRKATGLGCPDTAACDPAKYGLFNQLYGVAYWLVRYTTPLGTTGSGWTNYNWFPVGRANGVLYNPNAACGAKTITIENEATAALYYYTPYQPNAAALAAGWGLGDGCSAYGNRNFYLYFTTWFGSTHTVVTGAIRTFWAAHKATYGNPVANAVTVSANGGGTYQRFQKGTIYTSPAGSFGAAGSVLTKFTALGGPAGALGWPKQAVATVKGTNGGSTQLFQNGTVFVSTAGTAAVLAPIEAAYAAKGGRPGSLGWPTADAKVSTAAGGGTSQAFQGGRVVVAGGKSSVVVGSFLTIWVQRLAELGSMGWPTADKANLTAHGKKGVIQTFQTGVATSQGGTTRTVTGAIGANYISHGGPTGYLGWPTAGAAQSTANGGGWSQRFAGGAIFWSAATKAHALSTGKMLALYDSRGGVSGSLGWLQSSGADKTGIGGSTAVFTSGRIYSSKVGTVAVRGDILARYLAKGGTKSVLGWPTSNAKSGGAGKTVQTFQHGKITYTAAGGAVASRAASRS